MSARVVLTLPPTIGASRSVRTLSERPASNYTVLALFANRVELLLLLVIVQGETIFTPFEHIAEHVVKLPSIGPKCTDARCVDMAIVELELVVVIGRFGVRIFGFGELVSERTISEVAVLAAFI